MERLDGYYCPRCGLELTAVVVDTKIGTQVLGKKLSLDCDNCAFVWFGVPDTAPVKRREAGK